MASNVVLIDGVGNAVIYPRQSDVLTIVLNEPKRLFRKTAEMFDGKEVYRLEGAGAPVVRRLYTNFDKVTTLP